MNELRLLGVVCACVAFGTVSSAHAVNIEYGLVGGWTYEQFTPGTLVLSDNPAGGVTAMINVPGGIEDGGLSASRHRLSGFSLVNGVFIELEYNSLSSTVSGNAAYSDLNLELELFDSESNFYEIAMNISQGDGSLNFESWFDQEAGFQNYVEAPVPAGVATSQGALGLYVSNTMVMPYFRDAGGNLTFPFAGWDISQIIGAHSFEVDNDFEAYTLDGGSVTGSVNLERIVYVLPETATAQNYTFKVIANDSGLFSSFGSASINENGTVAFDADLDDGSAGVYTGNGGAFTTIADSETSWFSDPSINDNGVVAFIDQGNETIFTGNGGALITIADTSGLISGLVFSEINNDGIVAFKAFIGADDEAVYTGNGGALTTIADTSGDFLYLGALSINNSGRVAFDADFDDGSGSLYTGNGGALTTIADTSGELSAFDERTSINDSGIVAFWADLDNGSTGIFTGDGGPLTTIADSSGVYDSVIDPVINNNDMVAFEACIDDAAGFDCRIYTGPNPLTDVVIRLGDELDGSTVGQFTELLDMNDAGEIVFKAYLANNVVGLYVAIPTPIGEDADADSIPDEIDNCTQQSNPDQYDADGDGYGNLCDGDLNNDGNTNTLDLNLYKLAHRTSTGDASYNVDADFNVDGQINTLDLNVYKGLHRKPPGPSCCAP